MCFKDLEIKAMIERLNIRGNCSVCAKKNVFIYDTCDNNSDIVQLFDGLLDIYIPSSSLPDSFPKEKRDFLRNELFERWNIFNLEKEKIGILIKSICNQRYAENPDIFDEPVGIIAFQDESYITDNSILKSYEWEDFVEGIKNKNRFHTDYINLDLLNSFLKFAQKSYDEGAIFYRARISNAEGLHRKDMEAPPLGIASDGRVNASGISCLYLSIDKETTIREIRAGAHDFVTIGKFRLKQGISIVNLYNLHQISPFRTIDEIDFTQHAVNRKHLEKIGNEIARPLRRQDSPLDYLPTQYISDFIKSKGYEGIEYKSTMHEGGRNLAIFKEELLECIDVSVVKIEGINYSHRPEPNE
ncbi:RES family NAD+ phosphorylase [Paenibacillus albidus]|uniref:RES family NAD+ phosphorylase n=1 Tax=Paenibacillus albidus TaxID=2041023 RepID=UPI001BECE1B5|nr:RES family NAD+ phosphorylase [Paenibacillus albidus]MBT2289250.1 RES family NAD+ phosphorylase [Paenibacillus albidus]